MRLILASGSPRRADLLRAAGFEFETCSADIDERVRPGESPAEYVQRLASAKSVAAQANLMRRAIEKPAVFGSATTAFSQPVRPADDIIVVGADTAVVVDGAILGKPTRDEEGAEMLRRLSGRRHDVLTGVSVRSGVRETTGVETTAVYFATLSEAEIGWYVSSGEGRDKAGGYAIQGLASRFIPRIEGSYSNVVGLPIAVVNELIRKAVERD